MHRNNGVLLIGVPGIPGWASDSDHTNLELMRLA